ncbi:hypothetical protein LguiA_005253 [Lonicera macranthoides]
MNSSDIHVLYKAKKRSRSSTSYSSSSTLRVLWGRLEAANLIIVLALLVLYELAKCQRGLIGTWLSTPTGICQQSNRPLRMSSVRTWMRRTEQNAALAPKGISSLSNKYLSRGNQAVDNVAKTGNQIVHNASSDLVQKLDEVPKTKHAAAPRWNKLSHQKRNDTQGKSCTGTEGI